jgi:hypothetical protein
MRPRSLTAPPKADNAHTAWQSDAVGTLIRQR